MCLVRVVLGMLCAFSFDRVRFLPTLHPEYVAGEDDAPVAKVRCFVRPPVAVFNFVCMQGQMDLCAWLIAWESYALASHVLEHQLDFCTAMKHKVCIVCGRACFEHAFVDA